MTCRSSTSSCSDANKRSGSVSTSTRASADKREREHAAQEEMEGQLQPQPQPPRSSDLRRDSGSSYTSLSSGDSFQDSTKGEVQVPDEDQSAGGFSWKTLWAYAGPGWLMSIAYVDPGNLESDLQAGAYGGYQLIWVLLMSTIMGLFLQVLAARLGVVTGRTLAEMCRKIYPRWTSMILWIMTEIAIIGSDIQEVLGSAIALQILLKFPLWLGCLITAFDSFAFLFLHRYGIRKLEAFFLVLIGLMLVCFFVNFAYGGIDFPKVVKGFVPSLTKDVHTQAVGLLGAVIMPHNIFLHSALVQTRQIDPQNKRKVREANKYFAIEASGALFVSFLINLAVVGVFSKGFYSHDCVQSFSVSRTNTACIPVHPGEANDPTEGYGACTLANGMQGVCNPIGLAQAGEALEELLGHYAKYIWAVGLLAAGQSSTMTGTYAGQFVMEGFLKIQMAPWKRAALTRAVALVPAMIVSIMAQRSPEDTDHLGEWLNVLQSIQLPFALLPVLVITSSSKLMGSFSNSMWMRAFGWAMGLLVCGSNLYLVTTQFSNMTLSGFVVFVMVLVGVLYFCFLGYLIKNDVINCWTWMTSKWSHRQQARNESDSDSNEDGGVETPSIEDQALAGLVIHDNTKDRTLEISYA